MIQCRCDGEPEMNQKKRLKKLLGGRYLFEKYLSAGEIRRLLAEKSALDSEKLFASLTVGCVRIDAVVYSASGRTALGYDIFVKDTPDSAEWICYDNPSDEVKYSSFNLEQEMFSVLNSAVERYGLSYTECNFETVNAGVKPAK
ncbi:MAG: hypothetical protein ACI4IJ_10925 [Acutalibacteraceae bacterium]